MLDVMYTVEVYSSSATKLCMALSLHHQSVFDLKMHMSWFYDQLNASLLFNLWKS